MEPRVATLRRLTKLYGVIEHLRQNELERATVELKEAEAAIDLQRTAVRSARFDGREALAGGDGLEWQITHKRIVIAALNATRLEPLKVAREQARDAARASYLLSKLQGEQMKQVCDAATERLRIDEERRMQAVADDLFLSRQRWLERRDELRESE